MIFVVSGEPLRSERVKFQKKLQWLIETPKFGIQIVMIICKGQITTTKRYG